MKRKTSLTLRIKITGRKTIRALLSAAAWHRKKPSAIVEREANEIWRQQAATLEKALR